jgi:hypothetical protein
MFHTKLAARLMVSCLCTVAFAQQQQRPDCGVKPSAQALSPPQFDPNELFGAYVPYNGPKLPPTLKAADVVSTACYTPTEPTSAPISSVSKTRAQQPDSLIPQPTGSDLAAAFNTASSASSPGELTGTSTPAPDETSGESSGDSPAEAAAGGGGYLRRPPAVPAAATEGASTEPFRSLAIGFKAGSLGTGIELATPAARNFNLRSSFNFLAFRSPFSIDGLNYDARIHLQSSETAIDWFPLHTSFHISPGILYVKNSLSATTFVAPGEAFTLGTQPFVNSVDDPVTGSAAVVFPHRFAPMLLFGFGNILPRGGRHLSFPVEFGAAYTGAPAISVTLGGTACTKDGCANFATNTQAQAFLKQEVSDLNANLKKIPFYPIVSLGVAYHF